MLNTIYRTSYDATPMLNRPVFTIIIDKADKMPHQGSQKSVDKITNFIHEKGFANYVVTASVFGS